MDPKMDTGLDMPTSEERGKLTIDQSLKRYYSIDELLGIVDDLFSLEVRNINFSAFNRLPFFFKKISIIP